MRAKRASPLQELEFTGPEGPEILVTYNTKLTVQCVYKNLTHTLSVRLCILLVLTSASFPQTVQIVVTKNETGQKI